MTAVLVVTLILASCGGGETIEQTSMPDDAETASMPTTTVTRPAASQPDGVEVPAAPAPLIDGTVGAGEWDGAVSVTMSDQADVLLMHDGDVLHMAVVGTKVGAVNVVLATAEQVWILHSSAALGSAVYQAGESTWQLEHGFSWCCRDGSDESATTALYDAERWRANIGYAGEPGVVEYSVARPWSGAALAVSSIRTDTDRGFWPAGLSAEAQEQLVGVPPPERRFNIHEWAILSPAA